MFTDTITMGTTPVTYVRRTPRGNRSSFVPSGDTPSDERRLEIAHEVTAARKVNSLAKCSRTRNDPGSTVSKPEEICAQLTLKRPPSCTLAEYLAVADHLISWATTANLTKMYNQEQ